MGKLQAAMQREMELKGYSGKTISTYLGHMRRYTQYLGQPPSQAGQKEWIVYCKQPFGSAKQVIDDLGRYTHRIAISNERIIRLEDDQVTFSYTDRADHNKKKQMTLSAFEFIRRFLLHILPSNFVKIRHYGLSSNRHRNTRLRQAQSVLGIPSTHASSVKPTWQELLYRITGIDPCQCAVCGQGRLLTKKVLFPQKYRAPPKS